jgi:hypothetical protein
MDSVAAGKKSRKNPKKKENNASQNNNIINPFTNLNNFKSIKVPEKFEEKEKLLSSLKNAVGDIDLQMKTLKSKREYYNEIVEVLEREIKERRERQLQINRDNSEISVIQEELYSKLLLNFYSFI